MMNFDNSDQRANAIRIALKTCAKMGLKPSDERVLHKLYHNIIYVESDLVQGVMKFHNVQGDPNRVINEIQFNKEVQAMIDIVNLPFIFPQTIIDHQVANGFSWAVFKRLTGKKLGDPWDLTVVEGFEKFFAELQSLLNYFDMITDVSVGLYDFNRTDLVCKGLVKKMMEFSSPAIKSGKLDSQTIQLLCGIVEGANKWINFRLQHGDLVPWNMFDEGSQIGVIDSEWGGIRMRYYDVAYLYIKLYVCAKRPHLAKLWMYQISKCFSGHPTFERDIFFPLSYILAPEFSERLGENDREGFQYALELGKIVRSRNILDLMI